MLIEKKPTIAVNDTVSFRLNTGEELIAKIVALDDESITVSKPIVVQMQMVSQTQAGLGFAPFMSTADEDTTKFRFERSRLLCDPIKPRSDITAQYTKMTSSLVVPSAPSLVKV
jgi:hypothetical protein